MVLHVTRILGLVLLLTAAIGYPFLPGRFDPIAWPVSTVVQFLALAALPLVPLGLLWGGWEWWAEKRRKSGQPLVDRWRLFAAVAAIAVCLLALLLVLWALGAGGLALGLGALALSGWIVPRLYRRLRRGRPEHPGPSPAPLYLVLVPALVAGLQVALSEPVWEWSRNRAIGNSTSLIRDIETYRGRNGHYPPSLSALWPDYSPSVVGVERYLYALSGSAYSLYFEHPSFRLGTREMVMYQPHDEHVMPSHASWILIRTRAQLAAQQGWYEVRAASAPHWKYFWFD